MSEASKESWLEMKSLLASPRRFFIDDNFSSEKFSIEVWSFYKKAALNSVKPYSPRFCITGKFITMKINIPINSTYPIK